ncbi:MAG: hypothetical protein U0984_18625 [Prosthecobacter sp.]|nr:hypothetical protein [Prosthecobacter sp.]
MGQQLNKIVKRNRRKLYLARKKALVKAGVSRKPTAKSEPKAAKKVAKKAPAKKAAAKAAAPKPAAVETAPAAE